MGKPRFFRAHLFFAGRAAIGDKALQTRERRIKLWIGGERPRRRQVAATRALGDLFEPNDYFVGARSILSWIRLGELFVQTENVKTVATKIVSLVRPLKLMQ